MNLRALVPGIVLAGAAAAALSLLRTSPAVEVQALRAQLASAATTRLHVARLVGSFRYVTPTPPRRGPSRSSDIPAQLRMAAARAEALARDTLTPETIGLAGEARLLIGDESEAIDALEFAARAHPDSRTLTNLAAAYLDRDERADVPEDLVRALEASARAVAFRGAPPEAWFNRALACDRAALSAAAREAWHEYLHRDPAGPWADDARGRLAAQAGSDAAESPHPAAFQAVRLLGEAAALVHDHPQQAREWFDSSGSAEWAAALLAGDTAAAAARALPLRLVAAALRDRTGDDLVSMSAGELPTASPELARGYVAYVDGLHRYARSDRTGALGQFYVAEKAFTRAHSVRRYWASIQIALIAYHHRDLAESERRLSEVAGASDGRAWHALDARIAWLRGLILMQRGRIEEASEQYAEAARLYAAMGEADNAANVLNTAADTLRLLGDRHNGWRQLRQALARVDDLRDPIRRYLIFFNASLYAARDHLPLASLDFQSAAVAAASADTRSPAAQIEARLRRAAVLGRLGRRTDGSADIAAVRPLIATLPDSEQRLYFEATANMNEAELFPTVLGSRAKLDRAIAFFQRAEPAEIPRLLLARGNIERATGDARDAEQTLGQAVEAYTRRRRQLGEDDDRIAYLAEGVDIFTQLARLRLDVGRDDGAVFDAVEEGHGRSLFEDVRGVFTPLQPLDRLRPQLPAGVSVVAFSVMPEKTLVWIVDRAGVQRRIVGISADELTLAVDLLQMAFSLRAPANRLQDAARTLAGDILDPLTGTIPAGNAIVFVPDGPLYHVPFALLPFEGKALVESHALSMSPSLNLLATLLQRPPATGGQPLLVANPTASTDGFRALPDAQREVAAIEAMYPEARVLVGDAATPDAIAHAIVGAPVLHFAGHAVADQMAPRESRLVLAGPSASLTARQIAAMDLRGVRLVVLAACQTAGGPIREGEGVMNLARPFLAAGARTVVGSLWDLDDRSAAAAFIRFHEQVRRGVGPAQALRDVQLWMMRSSDSTLNDPASWAGLMVFGAGVN